MSSTMKEDDELSYYGLVPGPEKKVCSAHVIEFAVRSYVKKKGTKGKCDYCNKIKNVVSLKHLMKFLMDPIVYFYDDPTFIKPFGSDAGYYLANYSNAWEILQNEFHLEINNTDLLGDMESWIDIEQKWADEKALLNDGQYARQATWAYFCYLVKHQVRYLFQDYNTNIQTKTRKSLKPLVILREVEKMIRKYRMISIIPAGSQVFRCRQHLSEEIISRPFQMYAPDIEHCRYPNRMSPAGISMLYCAFDVTTSLNETLDMKLDDSSFTTVSFTLKEDTPVIDLSNLPPLPSRFDAKNRRRLEDVTFLQSFVHDLCKPIARDGKEHIDYVPTQIVTEYFRYMFKPKIDGIIYPSTKSKGNNSMVLFYNHWACSFKLTFLHETLNTQPIGMYDKFRCC